LYYRKDDGEGNVLDAPGKEDQYKMCCSAKIALWNVVGLQTLLPEESVKEKDVMVLKSEHVHIMSFAN